MANIQAFLLTFVTYSLHIHIYIYTYIHITTHIFAYAPVLLIIVELLPQSRQWWNFWLNWLVSCFGLAIYGGFCHFLYVMYNFQIFFLCFSSTSCGLLLAIAGRSFEIETVIIFYGFSNTFQLIYSMAFFCPVNAHLFFFCSKWQCSCLFSSYCHCSCCCWYCQSVIALFLLLVVHSMSYCSND